MNLINAFDPSAATTGIIDTGQAQSCGKVVLYNHSNVGLLLTFVDNSQQILPAWWVKTFTIPKSGSSAITWKQAYVLQSDSTNISMIYGESYAPNENAPNLNQQIFTTNIQSSVLNASNYGPGDVSITINVSNNPNGKLLYITGFTVSSGPPSTTQTGNISLQGVATQAGTPALNYYLTQSSSLGLLFDKVFPFPIPQLTSGQYYNGTVELLAQNFNPNVNVSISLYGIYK
jgi:hypothetical protein